VMDELPPCYRCGKQPCECVAALFVRRDSIYKTLPGVDCWDADRDATLFDGGMPVVAHPPCRSWGRLAHMAKPPKGEHALGPLAVRYVRRWGGVLEHPAASRLWAKCKLPRPDCGVDKHGGWSLAVAQSWWGHLCTKPTWLYICGCEPERIPSCVVWPKNGTHAICRDRRPGVRSRNAKRPEINHGERDMTPPAFAEWLVEIARRTRV
jgi:hypothetical protein